MENIIKKMFFALAMLSLASCGKDADGAAPEGGSGEPIRFDFRIDNATRVSTGADFYSDWEAGDQIGLFAVQSGAALQEVGNYLHNVAATFDGTSWSCPAYWLNNEHQALDFYAYYPYDDNNGNPEGLTPSSIGFSVATDQGAITGGRPAYNNSDLMMARESSIVRGSTVQLAFQHTMSLVEVDITERAINVPAYQSDKLKVKLSGVLTGASFNIKDIQVTATAGTEGDILMHRVDTGDPDLYVYRALIPQQAISAGHRLFHFEQDADDDPATQWQHNFSLDYFAPAATTFTPGKVHKYAVKLHSNTSHRYSVGDYYPFPSDPVGVVYWLDTTNPLFDPSTDSGPAGKVISLTQLRNLNWCLWGGDIGASDMTNGLNNMRAIMNFIKANPSWPPFNPYNWIHSMNDPSQDYSDPAATLVWYWPALDELLGLWNSTASYGRTQFDQLLTDAGGVALDRIYWASTEVTNSNNAYYVNFENNGSSGQSNRSNYHYSRAIMAF